MTIRNFLIMLFSVTLVGLSAEAASTTPRMPQILPLPDLDYPIWVDASLALKGGRPDPELLGPSANRLNEILSSPLENGCHAVGPVYFQIAYPEPRETIDDAIVHSRSNILGRVTGSSYGFYGGIPGQLLRVTPERIFGEAVLARSLFVFVPVGRFKVGNDDICKYDPAYAEAPAVGGEVFLFVGRPINGSIFPVGAEDIVPVTAKGILVLPRRFSQNANSHRREDLLQHIVSAKAERQKQGDRQGLLGRCFRSS